MSLNYSIADLLELAGNVLEKQDIRDISAPGALELNGIAWNGMPAASGLNDHDYQNLSILSFGHKQLTQLRTINKIPLPKEILEHFKHIKCHCMMGLFPEIGRAWLSIDSEIYIWTYEQSQDIAYYDGLNHLIISVGLVKPKSGVFHNNVKYLLILTTPIEIIVLGVTFAEPTKTNYTCNQSIQNGKMQLMNKPIFILSTDNVAINVVKATKNGRIFLGGKDGCLYELFYQAESSWFGKQCKKVNVSQGFASFLLPSFLKENDSIISIDIDDSRDFLYTLSEKGSIEVWKICQKYNSMKRIAKVTHSSLVQSAIAVIKTVDPVIFNNITSITALTKEDSPILNLFAISECGARLYFTTKKPCISNNTILTRCGSSEGDSAVMQSQTYQDEVQFQGMFLLHVRLPPGYTPNTTTTKPNHVHAACYKDGTLLLISTSQQNQDVLWSISSAPFSNFPYLTESTTILPLDGLAWGLEVISYQNKLNIYSVLRKAQYPTKILVLTNQGVHILELLKPIDILHQLLMACNGPQHEAIKAFFQSQSPREACATCLLLICSDQYRGTDTAIWAAQAFMLYGGEPSYQNQVISKLPQNCSTLTESDLNPPIYMPNPAINLNETSNLRMLQNSSFKPLSPAANNTNISSIFEGSNIVYSAKHDGLYLHVARLLRPFWKLRCINPNLSSAISQYDCVSILEDLYAIKNFLDANSGNEFLNILKQNSFPNTFFNVLQNNMSVSEQNAVREQAQVEEKRSLNALNCLTRHTCQVIEFWKILCEHQFQLLISKLSKEQQSVLKSCTFRDLTLSNFELCAALIVVLINSYLKDNASITALSTKLRDICPNLYRHEDAVAFKATEILMIAENCTIPEEKEEKLRLALQLCKDAAPNIPLQTICRKFTLINNFSAVIELIVICANKLDPEEFGIHFYKNEKPMDDQDGFAAFTSRMSCYKEIRVMLDYVFHTSCNSKVNYSQPFLENEESNCTSKIMDIANAALQFKDPLLHISIYEWLMMNNMTSLMISLSEPTLGEFLHRSVVQNPKNIKLIDLLWKYYEKHGYHTKAAQILDELATSKNDLITLEQRIEYLARAVMCLRNNSISCSYSNGIPIKEMEDKLEIARVQSYVLHSLKTQKTTKFDVSDAIKQLNFMLYDITQLYKRFAEPFDLLECKLMILKCSNHNDPLLIESVWSKILSTCIDNSALPVDRGTQLFTKFELLYNEFGDSGHWFPLPFLVRELEIKACQLKLHKSIVPEKLITMDFSIDSLLDIYSRMISLNERVWENEGNEWRLIYSSLYIITLISNNSKDILKLTKRRFFEKAQEIISASLNLCYQKPNTENLQQMLKESMYRLQRGFT